MDYSYMVSHDPGKAERPGCWPDLINNEFDEKNKHMTTKSPSSHAVDNVIQSCVKSMLKSENYRKTGRSFHRQREDMIQVVNFQTTWLNTPEKADFTINLKVILPFYHEKWTGTPLPKNPGSAAPICSYRLGHLLPEGPDKWWSVTPSTDFDSLSRQLADLLQSIGLPFLEKASDLLFLRQNLESKKHFLGMHHGSQPLAFAILLCYMGEEKEAKAVIQELRDKNRIKHFAPTIDLIVSRLGLRSNTRTGLKPAGQA
jgi:hypothetical protein